MSAVAAVTDRFHAEQEAYAHGADRPIGSYAGLLGVYSTISVGLGWLVRRRKALPERIHPGDLALLAVASHKLSRVVSKDSVTAVVRAPFTRFEEPAGDGEVNESPRGQGVQHALGELLTCPFCLSVWIATGFTFGLMLAPRATRAVASMLTVVTASDYLQYAQSALTATES